MSTATARPGRRWAAGTDCGLTLDLTPDAEVGEGDWIATEAGARYLVTSARLAASRTPRYRRRWVVRVLRLDYGCDVPADVHCIRLTWYRR